MFLKPLFSISCKKWSPKVVLWDATFAAVGPQGPPKTLPKWIRDPILFFLWSGINLETILPLFWFFLLPFRSHWLPSGMCLHPFCRFHADYDTVPPRNHTPWFAGSSRVRRSRSASTMTFGSPFLIVFHCFLNDLKWRKVFVFNLFQWFGTINNNWFSDRFHYFSCFYVCLIPFPFAHATF